ncbi:hypothetical protein ACFCV3_13635 [Kribbella sp. NPDC056345]|uniref:TPR repeat region-containing protein n=1 Tax=Kribbella sp. NPDC056345 TaxID=3345789 RepID=UPI0035DF2EE4
MAYKDEGGHGAQADGLCMIDPVVLGGVINDLATMESAIGAELKGLKAEFAKVGVSTQPLTDLTNVANWLHNELPMLRRRHAAAVLLASQGMPSVPGTPMLSMTEDPTGATKRAGELLAARLRDALDGRPPGKDGLTAAAKTLQQLTGRKGKLSPDDIAFLQALYGSLGRQVYRLPGQLGDDKKAKSAFVEGLLMLSNSKTGGGFDKLPAEIRHDARDNAWTYWNLPGDKVRTSPPGQGFHDLVAFLQNQDAGNNLGPGKELAMAIARSVGDEFRLKQWLADEYGNVAMPDQMKNNVYLDLSQAQQMLGLVSRNHDAATQLVGEPEFMGQILGQRWDDNGKVVAGLTDWAARAAVNPLDPEHKLAKEASARLINTVTTNDDDQKLFQIAVNGAKNNPEIARAFSRVVAANIADFGEDDPQSTRATSTNGDLAIPTDQRQRLAMLGGMDPQGRAIMRIAARTYTIETLGSYPEIEAARRIAAVDGIITAGGHNAIYYRETDDADRKTKALAAAAADDAAVDSILRKFYDTAAGLVPGGTAIGFAKDALSALLNKGMTLPEPDPVQPGQISTDKDATGAHVPEVKAAHDLADARLRADGGQNKLKFPPNMFKPDSHGRLQLKDLSEMDQNQRAVLRVWADRNAGTLYLGTYSEGFRNYYSEGSKVNDGSGPIKNFVETSTPR